jgi:hypothetical protein
MHGDAIVVRAQTSADVGPHIKGDWLEATCYGDSFAGALATVAAWLESASVNDPSGLSAMTRSFGWTDKRDRSGEVEVRNLTRPDRNDILATLKP